MGNKLDWDNMPPIGTKVVFKGYNDSWHTHWSYKIGSVYVIGIDGDGDIGPISANGNAPKRFYSDSFKFEIVEEK